MYEKRLLDLCIKDLTKIGILKSYSRISKYFSLKFEKVYPTYEIGWKEDFFRLYDKVDKIENLFTIGRGGLLLHFNIEHCIIQGLELTDFLLKNQ